MPLDQPLVDAASGMALLSRCLGIRLEPTVDDHPAVQALIMSPFEMS